MPKMRLAQKVILKQSYLIDKTARIAGCLSMSVCLHTVAARHVTRPVRRTCVRQARGTIVGDEEGVQ